MTARTLVCVSVFLCLCVLRILDGYLAVTYLSATLCSASSQLPFIFLCRNISVHIVTRLRAGCPRNSSSFPGMGKRLLRSVHVDCGAHPASSSTGNLTVISPGVKWLTLKLATHLQLVPTLRMSEAVLSHPV